MCRANMAGSEVYDCIVVGAGVEGSAAAYHLTKRGCRILLIEQFKLRHSRGSSHGQSRITRYAYRQKHYAHMMEECFQTWAQLEVEAGVQLFRNVGLLSTNGPPYTDVTFRSEVLSAMGKPFELLTARDLSSRYPAFSFGPEFRAFLDPNGGILMADRCVQALQMAFVNQGNIVQEDEKVLRIVPGKPVTILTNRGRYTAKSVVLAPGAWAPKIMRSLGLNPPLKISRIKVCYWPEKQPGTFANYPCFYSLAESYEVFGLPSDEHPGLVKVCFHGGEEVNDPDIENYGNDHTVEIGLLKRFITKYIPGLEAEPAIIENCLYTTTPDEELIVDKHPDHPNIIIGCGGSGHGFKLAPAVGKVLSDLATGNAPSYDISPMSLKRFPNNGRLTGAKL